MHVALLGSGEFLPWVAPVDRWCVERAPAASERVLIVPTASAPEGEDSFSRWAAMGVEHYRSIGLEPEVLELRTRADADDATIASAVEGARLIFFSGGNPGYLAETLRGTAFWDAALRAFAKGTALGGCSAGACAIGNKTFWVGGDRLERWVEGLGLLPNTFVLPHFDALDGYQPGLRRSLLLNRPPGSIVLGLDEETALYGNDAGWHVAGKGGVWVAQADVPAHEMTAYRDGDHPLVRLALPVG